MTYRVCSECGEPWSEDAAVAPNGGFCGACEDAGRSYGAPRAAGVGTLLQYERRQRERALAVYEGLSGREYDESYPRGSRWAEWVNEVEVFVRDGGVLTRYEADSLVQNGIDVDRVVFKFYPDARPPGYLVPTVRAWNKTARIHVGRA